MARCAVVKTSDYVVVNLIVADAGTDVPPDGCILVDIDYFPQVDFGWIYDPVMIDFRPPPGAGDGN